MILMETEQDILMWKYIMRINYKKSHVSIHKNPGSTPIFIIGRLYRGFIGVIINFCGLSLDVWIFYPNYKMVNGVIEDVKTII